MKLTEAISYAVVALTLGVLAFLVQLFLPGASIAVLSEFCMILAFAVMVIGVAHLISGKSPREFSGRMIFRVMLLPLLYLLVGIIFVEVMNGASGKMVLMNIVDWIGFFFVLGMTFCLGCSKCCK